MADFTDALEKVVLGTPRQDHDDAGERQRTAHHEGGHALLGMLTPGADPVRKVSIIPRGHALGVTFQSPDADQYAYSEDYLRGRIVGALGGMAAEQVVYGNVSTGAESDLDQVSRIARQMVGRWGMSPRIGPDRGAAGRGAGAAVPGPTAPGRRRPPGSWWTAEARRIVDECYERAVAAAAGQPGPAGPAGPGAAGARDARLRGRVRGRRRAPHRPSRTSPGGSDPGAVAASARSSADRDL